MATFKERVRELRKQREWSQQDLADHIGVTKQTISQYERGVRKPEQDTLLAICDLFNVSSDYLLGATDVTVRLLDSAGLKKLDSPAAISSPLSGEEEEFLFMFRELNRDGREQALEYFKFLSGQEKFSSDTESSKKSAM